MVVSIWAGQQNLILPLPSSPKCGEHEFGGGEHDVGMNIFIYAQLEIVLPLFLSRMVLRGTNGGTPATQGG